MHVQKVSVFINEIKSGSLFEDLVVKFLWGSQEKLHEEVDGLRKEFRVDSIISNRALVGAIVGALTMGGGIYLLNKIKGGEEQKHALQNNQNIFILNGANLAGLTQEQFKSVIDSAVSRNEQLPKNAVKVIRPAKRESGSTIVLNSDRAAEIGTKAVQAMPSSVADDDKTETIEDFHGVEVQIRAIDLDSTKRGWAAVVPSIDPRRTKMHLDPHINFNDLVGKTAIVGEITVVFKYDDSGKRYPSLIFLRNIRK